MSNAVPAIASHRVCDSCGRELVLKQKRPQKRFCNKTCLDNYFNARKRQRMNMLREKYPEVYKEIFECTPA